MGDQIYNVEVFPEVLNISTSKDEVIKEHVTFRLHMGKEISRSNSSQSEVQKSGSVSPAVSSSPAAPAVTLREMAVLRKDLLLDAETFCLVFPFHVVFDSSLKILQCGNKIQQLSGG